MEKEPAAPEDRLTRLKAELQTRLAIRCAPPIINYPSSIINEMTCPPPAPAMR